jgi:hypothetical protein
LVIAMTLGHKPIQMPSALVSSTGNIARIPQNSGGATVRSRGEEANRQKAAKLNAAVGNRLRHGRVCRPG